MAVFKGNKTAARLFGARGFFPSDFSTKKLMGRGEQRGNRYLRVLFVSSKIVKGGCPGLDAADRATQAKIAAISLAVSVAFGLVGMMAHSPARRFERPHPGRRARPVEKQSSERRLLGSSPINLQT